MDGKTETVLRRYLGEIEGELERLPRTLRREITAEIRSHLLEEWRCCDEQTLENMLNIINNFGEPREIASGYLEQHSGQSAVPALSASYPPSWLIIILTLFLWPAGIILAWLSPAWKTRDKLIATLVPPLLFLIVVVVGMVFYSCTGKAEIRERESGVIVIEK